MSNTHANNKIFNVSFGKHRQEVTSVEEVDRKGWVKWGKKNDYPQFLIELLNSSPLHQGIINGKVSYIVNEGWEVVQGGADVESFLENGVSDYDLHEVADMAATDLETFGAFVLKCTMNKNLGLSFVECLDFDLCRLSEDEMTVYFSENWADARTEVKEFEVYDANKQQYQFCLVFKQSSKREKGELGIYPKPSYIAGLRDIETDREISKYHLNEILNGFTGGTVINVPTGIPETDEEKAEARKYIEKFTGAGEAGSVIVNFSDGQEQQISVVHLNGNDLDKRYLATEESIKGNILTAHSVPNPLLVGIQTPSKLGGATEIEISFGIWNKTYIARKQRIINNAFNYVMETIAKIQGRIELQAAELPFTRPASVQLKMSKKNDVNPINEAIKIFDEYGTKLSTLDVYSKVEVPHGAKRDDIASFEAEVLHELFNEIGTLTASGKLLSVLDLVRKGDPISVMPDVLDTDLKTVMTNIKRLQELGYIDGLNVTQRGVNLLNASQVPTEEFEVRYTYELRDGIDGAKIIPTTRDFCREVIELDRAYTREEIDTISSRVGWDVWFERGGWYHNPQTGQNTPFCRHIWKFILTKKQ
jgi:hypothetical protein